jgi:hypothetical protein
MILKNIKTKESKMPKFIIAYHGGTKPATQEEGMAQMQNWKSWIADLGDAVINPGTPLGNSKTVTANGTEDAKNAMNGYMIVKADDLEAAIKIAKSDPFLQMESASVEIAQIVEMG